MPLSTIKHYLDLLPEEAQALVIEGRVPFGAILEKYEVPHSSHPRGFFRIAVDARLAELLGATSGQIALAWLLYQPVVSTVIVGAKRADQLADNIAAGDVELTADELAELDRLSALPREYPGWMFEVQGGYVDDKISRRRQPA